MPFTTLPPAPPNAGTPVAEGEITITEPGKPARTIKVRLTASREMRDWLEALHRHLKALAAAIP